MKKLSIPVDALESERINKGIRRLVREGFLKDNPDSQIKRTEAEWGPATKGGKVELKISEVMQCAAC
ncbi:hypothetical protein NGK65_04925 [Serratia ureilytica]|uniref:hypothetical protein n=1 Tax=Serratia ureilytica TaxID=300181 RepID=UPI002DBC7DDC|nr:hypothetical protein [Serratia ureilytica]MEB7893073.1 hypothetical protein [Serratia ureilytica]